MSGPSMLRNIIRPGIDVAFGPILDTMFGNCVLEKSHFPCRKNNTCKKQKTNFLNCVFQLLLLGLKVGHSSPFWGGATNSISAEINTGQIISLRF